MHGFVVAVVVLLRTIELSQPYVSVAPPPRRPWNVPNCHALATGLQYFDVLASRLAVIMAWKIALLDW